MIRLPKLNRELLCKKIHPRSSNYLLLESKGEVMR